MKRIYVIVIIFLALLNGYLFKVITDLENRIDTTDDLVINNAINGYTTEITNAVKDVDKVVVAVKTIDTNGTGFIYSTDEENAYIVTAAHVVKNQNYLIVEFNNYRTLQAEVLGMDLNTDVAILKVTPNFPVETAKLSKNSILKDGEFVISVGASNNSNHNTYKSLGIISSSLDFQKVNGINNAYIVTDNHGVPGLSGGPIINISSEVIGMCVMSSNDSANAYSLTIDEIKYVADQIINEGQSHKYDLNIKFKPVNKMETYQKSSLGVMADEMYGIYIYDVAANEYGNYLGLTNGDIITAINDVKINNLEDYLRALYNVEDSITISVIREGEELVLESLVEARND